MVFDLHFLTSALTIDLQKPFISEAVTWQESAKKLGLESIDLVLPHWPGIGTEIELAEQNFILRKQTWKALEDLQKDGSG